MTKIAALTAAALALMISGAPSAASAQTLALPWASIEAPEAASPTKETKTWYVMIAIEQALGPRGCEGWRYKVSMSEPLAIEGPQQFTSLHADEIVASWMLYLNERSPAAYKWLNGPHGHDNPQVYLRESREEAIAAFREDGHLKLTRSCEKSALVAHPTSKFAFDPPEGFTDPDFVQAPMQSDALVVRQLAKIPGLPERN